ncbi:DnaJ C-terminal domain-containing protein [Variovorax sp. RTB1]|uniref:DnaJ C-terminal domain-containing protein n=1 Tax=Variovorax sp. RTB1 TaxID=3048631 RepID=UPI002B224852|nr:DnaJ C-terminal domain-containing protein [Variovorax sp. RTB1]MEB0111925.1 DnaJ C-terminal domain-containing protein [Variovorax sp. RTB1]
MEFKDYYKALGLASTASEDEVRKAYRKLARKYHPDVSKEADAEVRMRDINEANDVLRDKEKRAAYDALAARVARGEGMGGRAGSPGGPGAGGDFQPPPGWDEGFEFHRGPHDGPADHADFSEFFSSMFGASERRGAERRNHRAKGEDHHAAIEISLEDAINGAEREITLRALDTDAQGQPAFVNRILSVKIPAGVHPGQFIRLTGHGMPGQGGEPAGDLYLEVRIAPHKLYRIEERDLYMTLPVTPTEAALGAQVKVPTPGGGVVEVTVPRNARSGLKLRLKERGLPGKPRGNLYLLLEIALPPADTDAARQAYEQLAKAAPFDPRRHLGISGD